MGELQILGGRVLFRGSRGDFKGSWGGGGGKVKCWKASRVGGGEE